MTSRGSKPFAVLVGDGPWIESILRHLECAGFRTALVVRETSEAPGMDEGGAAIRIRGNMLDPGDALVAILESADLVIAADACDDTNALAAIIALRMPGARKVLAIRSEADRKSTFARYDIPTICPGELMAEAALRLVANRNDEGQSRGDSPRS